MKLSEVWVLLYIQRLQLLYVGHSLQQKHQIIISGLHSLSVVHCMLLKQALFSCCCFVSLFQSEYGDIYKATLVYEGETVTELKVKYFDTLPVCVSLAVLKTGFLFTASETGNHALYQFVVSDQLRYP